MGDVLPPKRQTVVERLKRRFELYRRHQNACLPRYEQSANGLYEAQRQETLLLKQRFLESKAKKAKSNKSDHHRNYKESIADGSKSQLHVKPLKRPADDSTPTAENGNNEDGDKPAKITRTETTAEKTPAPDIQAQQQQQSLPGFSVQIVQQFTKAPHSQQSQTIQTSVTVQTLSKPLNSPLPQAPQSVAPNSQAQDSSTNQQDKNQVPPIGTNIECKQEKDSGQSDLCQFKNSQTTNVAGSGGDRLSDTFPSLGFTDESGDDVIHPDILKDLIDDVFTNSADIMKDFNFEDSVGSMKDQDEATKEIMDLVKGSSPTQLRPFQPENVAFVNTPANQHQQNGLFRNIATVNETSMPVLSTATTTLSQGLPTATTASSFYNTQAQRLPSYGNSSLSLPSGLSLDFKLTEPSPAALTLKQMAEQHQNMQQKQQQQMVNSPLGNRPSPFSQDSFNAHINPLRSTGFLNGSNSAIPSNSPKTPNSGTNLFNSFDRPMNSFPGTESLNTFPGCEPISPNNLFEPDIRARTSAVMTDSDRAKQQRLQIDSSACHQLDQQKPPAYGTTRPLTHFSENAHLRHQNPLNGQHQRPMGRQFQNNIQMTQPQHMHPGPGQQQQHAQQLQQNSHDLKQQHMMQPHSNLYGNYTPQQPVSNAFHVPMSQSLSYSTHFTSAQTVNRPPPEYKAHHSNLPADNLNLVEQLNSSSHMIFNHPTKNKYASNMKHQRPPNVTVTPDGSAITSSSGEWRHNVISQQHHNQFRMGSFPHQDNFGELIRSDPLGSSAAQSPLYNQYRIPNNQIAINRVVRPNMVSPNHMLIQQRQRMPTPQRPRNPSVNEIDQHSSITMNNSSLSPVSVMGPMFPNQQDMNRNDGSQINLDFLDNIESSASDLLNFDQVMQGGGTHFPLLDDMEILGK